MEANSTTVVQEWSPNVSSEPSAEAKAAMAANAPANVPDKFKNADGTVNLEALVQGYKEAEKKIGAPKKDEAKPDAKPAPSLDEAFAAPEPPKGNTWAEAQAEIAKDGKLSQTTREALKKNHAATDDMIDGMVAGAQAQRALVGQRLADAVGGVEKMNAAIAYAKSTMKPDELASLKDALSGKTGPMILKGLYADMASKAGTKTATKTDSDEPKSAQDLQEGADTSVVTPFSSQAEHLAAIRDPRYKYNEDYRAWVTKRAVASR